MRAIPNRTSVITNSLVAAAIVLCAARDTPVKAPSLPLVTQQTSSNLFVDVTVDNFEDIMKETRQISLEEIGKLRLSFRQDEWQGIKDELEYVKAELGKGHTVNCVGRWGTLVLKPDGKSARNVDMIFKIDGKMHCLEELATGGHNTSRPALAGKPALR